MIQIKPEIQFSVICTCGHQQGLEHQKLIWQGPHVCTKSQCRQCGKNYICDIPVGQSKLTNYIFDVSGRQLLAQNMGRSEVANSQWYSNILNQVLDDPIDQEVKIDIELFQPTKEVIILNTLDFLYGHSLLTFLNLQNLLIRKEGVGIIVIVQPFLRWMVPDDLVSEVWTVHLKMPQMKNYYPRLNERFNQELERFDKVYLSAGHVLPHPVKIEKFTKINPYDFESSNPRITYVWREDTGRLWINSKIIQKGFEYIGLKKVVLFIHYLKILSFLTLLKFKLGTGKYRVTVAGLGKFGRFPKTIEDCRVNSFALEDEIATCNVYADSLLVVGIHGSSMILPSAHAGMSITLTPAWKWGNCLEDILFREEDVRLANFQKRVLPSSLSIRELIYICSLMITGREYFIRKFIYDPCEL
jgi:hypothetical protein